LFWRIVKPDLEKRFTFKVGEDIEIIILRNRSGRAVRVGIRAPDSLKIEYGEVIKSQEVKENEK
jgi:sRNA-binding carbon storage regulator CsrA